MSSPADFSVSRGRESTMMAAARPGELAVEILDHKVVAFRVLRVGPKIALDELSAAAVLVVDLVHGGLLVKLELFHDPIGPHFQWGHGEDMKGAGMAP